MQNGKNDLAVTRSGPSSKTTPFSPTSRLASAVRYGPDITVMTVRLKTGVGPVVHGPAEDLAAIVDGHRHRWTSITSDSAIITTTVVQATMLNPRELTCVPISSRSFVSRSMKIRMNGSRTPLTTCDSTRT